MRFLLAALAAGAMLGTAPAPAGETGTDDFDLLQAVCRYPAGISNAQGISRIAFEGLADGTLGDVRLALSSGHAKLDEAALACVKSWHFNPADSKERHYLGAWQLDIFWAKEGFSLRGGFYQGGPHYCADLYPPAALTARASGTTKVRFTITAEGDVIKPEIALSSGNADLDAAALTCAASWRYKPAIADGKPVAVPWAVEVHWVLPATAVPAPDADPKAQ